MKAFRFGLIFCGALGTTLLFGSQIKALEDIRKNGDVVLLDLRPVDPRALMMGDFMALAYDAEQSPILPKELPPKGQFILKLDDNRVGRFQAVANSTPLGPDEIIINYIRARRGVTFGAPRFYFENGTAELYEPSRYGIFKVSPSGRAILTGLADESFVQIIPQ